MKKYFSIPFALLSLSLLTLCSPPDPVPITSGVSEALAKYRKAAYSNIRYDLYLDIPNEKQQDITGKLSVRFNHNGKPNQDLILDFSVASSLGQQVTLLEPKGSIEWKDGHLIISKTLLSEGENSFTLQFIAGNQSLNRNEDYLYTLFVPDRASTAFPCFDQPDLKARFTLSMTIPSGWEAITNYSLKDKQENIDRMTLIFNETAPLPTYLFAFAAGRFQVASSSDTRLPMTIYYRETDTKKVTQNLPEIFRLHQQAIDWMENYTEIPYPFEKFDFALLPPFQYGGMEHPGSIFYRERSLFLDGSATLNDSLGRASLIAHETAHIWFGDLVTMKWFNDVWSKEVFANFMADKIVNPSFPQINHDLKFLMRHFPAAYDVDRTKGANAIRQPLDNLKNAGLMYGPIIYNKAPIMMKHLEQLSGPAAFRDGMRTYLSSFAYDNADWNDLIKILDQQTTSNLQSWSDRWIESPGMPIYQLNTESNDQLTLTQEDPLQMDRRWMQQLKIISPNDSQSIYFAQQHQILNLVPNADFLLINGQGMEYGGFLLNAGSIDYLIQHYNSFDDPFFRGRLLLNLHETFLAGQLDTSVYFDFLWQLITDETDPQLLSYGLSQLRTIYWQFLNSQDRQQITDQLESSLQTAIRHTTDRTLRIFFYRTWLDTFLSEDSWHLLYQTWKEEKGFWGINLSPRDYTTLALELSLRISDQAQIDSMMQVQMLRLANPDEQKRLQFIQSAISPDSSKREDFFNSLLQADNRENEPWVLTALGYLHHPLRQQAALPYLKPGLEAIREIQITGDIFFPGRWLDVSLAGHQSEEALEIVKEFMVSDSAHSLDEKLRMKIWVAVDRLERSVAIRQKRKEALTLIENK